MGLSLLVHLPNQPVVTTIIFDLGPLLDEFGIWDKLESFAVDQVCDCFVDVSIQSLLQIPLSVMIQLDFPLLPEDFEMVLCLGHRLSNRLFNQ